MGPLNSMGPRVIVPLPPLLLALPWAAWPYIYALLSSLSVSQNQTIVKLLGRMQSNYWGVYTGVPKQGGTGGIYLPNNESGCTSDRKLGKKCSIFDEDHFFWSSPELGKKVFHFFLFFTKFPNLNKNRG